MQWPAKWLPLEYKTQNSGLLHIKSAASVSETKENQNFAVRRWKLTLNGAKWHGFTLLQVFLTSRDIKLKPI
jgi:hypothetical protein